MKRVISSRNSPAIVIAIFALVAAVAGSAVAGPIATSSKKKLTVAKVRNIANQQIEKKAPGLTVARSKTVTKGGVLQTSFKGSFALTLDFATLAPAQCQVLFPASPVTVADGDAIIETSPRNASVGVVTETYSFAPSIAIEGCNVSAGALDQAPVSYRFTIIG